VKVPAVNFYRAEKYRDDFEAFGLWSARQIEEAILREGPDTVAAVFLESVQNAGGCFTLRPVTGKRCARSAIVTASCWCAMT